MGALWAAKKRNEGTKGVLRVVKKMRRKVTQRRNGKNATLPWGKEQIVANSKRKPAVHATISCKKKTPGFKTELIGGTKKGACGLGKAEGRPVKGKHECKTGESLKD